MVGPDTYPAQLTEYYVNGRRVIIVNATTATTMDGTSTNDYWDTVTYANRSDKLHDALRSLRRLALNLSWVPNQREAHGGLPPPEPTHNDLPANIPAPTDLRMEIRRITTPRRQLVP